MKKWISENFYNEILLAIRGLGKYRLAPGYTSFSVDPTLWSKWSDQRKEQHMKRFKNRNSKFIKNQPMLVKKGNSFEMKRRSSQRGAEIFIDRVCKDTFTPIKLTKTNKETGEWEVEGNSMDLDPLNTNICISREGSKHCPKRVKR